jgi:hypothetical protein
MKKITDSGLQNGVDSSEYDSFNAIVNKILKSSKIEDRFNNASNAQRKFERLIKKTEDFFNSLTIVRCSDRVKDDHVITLIEAFNCSEEVYNHLVEKYKYFKKNELFLSVLEWWMDTNLRLWALCLKNKLIN